MPENNLLNQIARKDPERLSGYRDLLEFYRGKQWPGRERWGEKRLTLNYARIFIDKITSYLMAGSGYTVEALEDSPAARRRAEQAEKALARVAEINSLEQLDFETEIDCAVLGDACYKVTWDTAAKQVRVTAPDIQGIYAWWQGDDPNRIWRVASRYTLSAEEGENPSQSPFAKGRSVIESPAKGRSVVESSAKGRTMVEVWTDREFVLYADGVPLEKKANPYGFIPYVIFHNLREPQKFWGTSDLEPLIEPQRELNRAMSQISHILELSGNPVAVLENVEESTDIAVRPGAVWNLPEDAKAYLLDLLQGGGLKLHVEYIELLYRAMHDISEAPRAAFGGADRNLSGVALQIELYPLMQKVMRKRAIRTAAYNRRNRLILKLLDRFQKAAGEDGQTLWDPDQYRLRMVWGQVMPQDREALVKNEQTLVQEGIHSRRRAMDEVGVKDPEAEFSQWLEEKKMILENGNAADK